MTPVFKARKVIRPDDEPEYSASVYETALMTLLSCHEKIRIVIIGANDGAINDPAYNFIKKYADQTEVLLVEPQETLLPYLKSNYAFHPLHHIHCGAVGPEGIISLYSVNPEYYRYLRTPSYARGWPAYRAPTGVTSSDIDNVRRFLRRYLKNKFLTDRAIMHSDVRCCSLASIMEEKGLTIKTDVLQIDTEGFDDEAIYSSNIETTAPRIIYFEAKSLSAERYTRLKKNLEKAGYSLSRLKGDALAIRIGLQL